MKRYLVILLVMMLLGCQRVKPVRYGSCTILQIDIKPYPKRGDTILICACPLDDTHLVTYEGNGRYCSHSITVTDSIIYKRGKTIYK